MMEALSFSPTTSTITTLIIPTTISNAIPISPKHETSLPSSSVWHYRIEGSQKVVFSNSTNSSTPSILCLYPYNVCPPPSRPPFLIRGHLHPYLFPSVPSRLSSSYISDLLSQSRSQRPPRRVANTPNNPSTFVTLHPDAAFSFGSSTILVELKPKTARPSISKLIPPNIARLLYKYSAPPYHIKNYLLPHNQIPSNPYQPSDLLSGSYQRAASAVNILLQEKARGLRVFYNGTLQNSLSEYKNAIKAAAFALSDDQTVVNTISNLQAKDVLDGIGAELVLRHLEQLVGIYEAKRMIHFQLQNGPWYCGDIKREQKYQEIVKQLSYESPDQGINVHCEEEFQRALDVVEDLDVNDAARLIAEYLQAATAKDCSLLIALSRKDDWERDQSKEFQTDELSKRDKRNGEIRCSMFVDGVKWYYRIWIVDVDEKPISKIESKWGMEDRRRAAILARRNGEEF